MVYAARVSKLHDLIPWTGPLHTSPPLFIVRSSPFHRAQGERAMRLGYIGLGNMGEALARRLVREHPLRVPKIKPESALV